MDYGDPIHFTFFVSNGAGNGENTDLSFYPTEARFVSLIHYNPITTNEFQVCFISLILGIFVVRLIEKSQLLYQFTKQCVDSYQYFLV